MIVKLETNYTFLGLKLFTARVEFLPKVFFLFNLATESDQIGLFCDDIATKFLPKVAQIFGNFWVILKNVAY